MGYFARQYSAVVFSGIAILWGSTSHSYQNKSNFLSCGSVFEQRVSNSVDLLSEYSKLLNFKPGEQKQLRHPLKSLTGQLAVPLKFGFESEYTLDWSDKLLDYYGPSENFKIPKQVWLSWSPTDRIGWVKQNIKELFPEKRGAGGLVLLTPDNDHTFLPQSLIIDTNGNLELILAPFPTLEDWYEAVSFINSRMRTGSMQATTGIASENFFEVNYNGNQNKIMRDTYEANLGFFKFVSDSDALSKLAKGAEKYRQDPTKEVARSFTHPFLGPMTKMKMELLKEMLKANSNGKAWDKKSLDFVSESDASFKYVATTTYRPDIAGPKWVVLEARDAHSDMNMLLSRVVRATYWRIHSRKIFEGASYLPDFDSWNEFLKFPTDVRQGLKKIFPAKLEEDTTYSAQELFALQSYRNFAFPLRNWNEHLKFLGRGNLSGKVDEAKNNYFLSVSEITRKFITGGLTASQASIEIQGALADFSESSGLASAFANWEDQQLQLTSPPLALIHIFYQKTGLFTERKEFFLAS